MYSYDDKAEFGAHKTLSIIKWNYHQCLKQGGSTSSSFFFFWKPQSKILFWILFPEFCIQHLFI